MQEKRTYDLLQSDDEAEDVDAEEVNVGMVESIIEPNVGDPPITTRSKKKTIV